jgi:hypothetical protein
MEREIRIDTITDVQQLHPLARKHVDTFNPVENRTDHPLDYFLPRSVYLVAKMVEIP